MNECMKKWLGRSVKIELKNGYFYKGKVIEVGNNFLMILDITNREVYIAEDSISTIVTLGGEDN